MLILTIRTDKPQAEVGLFQDNQQVGKKIWSAHRQLAETIHQTIHELIKQHNNDWADIQAVVFYKGPGSFTGLRIGASVANSLAYSLSIPIVAVTGEDWAQQGIKQILDGNNKNLVVPEYGSPPHITASKK